MSRRHISGAVVPVRFGLFLAVCGAAVASLLGFDVVGGTHAWHQYTLAVASLAVSGLAAWYGIYGVIRYGLFTEGCGTEDVARELRLSRVAYAAGGLAQVTLMATVVLTIVLIVRTL